MIGQSSFETARDTIRHEIHTQSPAQFPYGPEAQVLQLYHQQSLRLMIGVAISSPECTNCEYSEYFRGIWPMAGAAFRTNWAHRAVRAHARETMAYSYGGDVPAHDAPLREGSEASSTEAGLVRNARPSHDDRLDSQICYYVALRRNDKGSVIRLRQKM